MVTRRSQPETVARRLTSESLARLEAVRERILQGRTFSLSSDEVLRQLRGEQADDGPPAQMTAPR